MNIITNNQSSLEKFFKSRNMIISILVATSLLQAVHTALVIKHLTFIESQLWGWAHSLLLAVCIELYIVVFSIRSNHKLAVMYLWFAVLINIGMSYIQHDFSFSFFFYALITTIFPLSVYYTAGELAKKHYEHKPVDVTQNNAQRKRGRKKKSSPATKINLEN